MSHEEYLCIFCKVVVEDIQCLIQSFLNNNPQKALLLDNGITYKQFFPLHLVFQEAEH